MAKKTSNFASFNMKAQYERDHDAVDNGVWVDFITEAGVKTNLRFKIAYADNAAYKKLINDYWQSRLVLPESEQMPSLIERSNIDNEYFAQTILKNWGYYDENNNFIEGVLPWGDEQLDFNVENAKMLLALKLARETFYTYVAKIADDFTNFRKSRLEDDIKNS